uniref:N-acetyltransferase ESCO zinc-finger domain-containing protein n=1 Tax=Oryza glumipatula TaxID=40148 RepID=A0A0D9ZMP6_9ORYZ
MTRGEKGMQPKISAFFKRQAPEPETSRFFILVPSSNLLAVAIRGGDTHREGTCGMEVKRPKSCADGKVLNKKRNYAQFHLELGQPDFLLHMCSVCGMMYARGNDEDEKAHKAYHKSYFEGVPFKGWRNETVVARSEGGDRIILVTDENSCARNSKVQEVIKVVQKELGFGEGQLLHKLCKRIVGCLVVEPIKTAHKVIPGSTEENGSDLPVDKIEPVKTNHTLEFGKISFKREVLKRHDHSDKNKEEYRDPGAIICEKEDVPAHCGFRAIWVVPSRRRKRIGSQLMDAASIPAMPEKLPRRRDFVHLTVRFLTAYFLREGAGTQLLQDQRILSLQGARCIGDAAEDTFPQGSHSRLPAQAFKICAREKLGTLCYLPKIHIIS